MVSKLKVLWAVSFPRCTVGPDIGRCTLHPFSTPLLTRMQQLPTMLAQQCCQLLRPFLHVNSSSLNKEWEWINGFHKLKKISLLVTTTQRLWNWVAILAPRVTWPSSNIFKEKNRWKNKPRDLIWVGDSYIKQRFTLNVWYESPLLFNKKSNDKFRNFFNSRFQLSK